MKKATRTIRYMMTVALAIATLPGVAMGQNRGNADEAKNVRLVLHFVEADGFKDQDPEIEDVVTELRKIFKFKGYRVHSTSVLNLALERTRIADQGDKLWGRAVQRTAFKGRHVSEKLLIRISAEVTAPLSSENLRVEVNLTDITNRGSATIVGADLNDVFTASVTIRDGQMVVLGTTRLFASKPVLILVVTPQIDPKNGTPSAKRNSPSSRPLELKDTHIAPPRVKLALLKSLELRDVRPQLAQLELKAIQFPRLKLGLKLSRFPLPTSPGKPEWRQ